MKAVVAEELSGRSRLVYRDVADIPDFVDDCVVIEVRAAGVKFPDLLVIRGEYQMKAPPGFIPGAEAAGIVVSAPEESAAKADERVSAVTMNGGFAERIAVPPESVFPTASGSRRRGIGCAAAQLGIGTAAVQLAKTLGAKVIAAVHRKEAIGCVESLGADVVLPLTDGWLQAVRDRTDGRGVDVVVDPVGGEAFDDAVRALAAEGRLLVLGFAAGAIPTLKVNRLLMRNVSVVGVGWGEYFLTHPGAEQLFGSGVSQLVAAGLKPPPPVRYPLSDARAALQALAEGEVFGKLVLEP